MTTILNDERERECQGASGAGGSHGHAPFKSLVVVSEYAPVNDVWLLVRTVATVTVRWFGEYVVRCECGPYEMVLMPEAAPAR